MACAPGTCGIKKTLPGSRRRRGGKNTADPLKKYTARLFSGLSWKAGVREKRKKI
jgi:hypothetical protein